MGTVRLPLYNLPYYDYVVSLDGNEYRFTIKWNNVDESWFLSLDGITDTTVQLHGVPLRNNSPILFNQGFYQLGELAVLGTAEPGFDIADTHELIYRERD